MNKAKDGRKQLRGVSTLDFMKRNLRIIWLLLMMTFLSGVIYGGHSILDIVDPTFNPEIVANLYGTKNVQKLETLPDGKILAIGKFNSYNRVPTGSFVRLNADGSLDTTFNNQTITSTGNCYPRSKIIVQPDGKIILSCENMVANGQSPKPLLRLNADGTLDTSFNYTLGDTAVAPALDSLGRIAIYGSFQTPQGLRLIARLNPGGSLDTTFNYSVTQSFATTFMTTQGSRIIIGGSGSGGRILRLNENGSEDTSFALSSVSNGILSELLTQPDNKILYLKSNGVFRLNENGGSDGSFQTSSITDPQLIKLAADGKMVVTAFTSNATFHRFLANGGEDPSFNPYTHPMFTGGFAIQPDGSVIIGDAYTQTSTQGLNNFIRLTPAGFPDPTFNPGGIAFQTILPGSIRAIEPLPDGKVFLGGKFDLINTLTRPKIARLNADATVDSTFQINTSGTGNYFSQILNVYYIRALPDGKIVVSGWFDYVLNGETKKNLVRLNSDGSIDTTFNLTETINDWSEVVGAGRNPIITFSDGKLLVGISKLNGFGPVGPLKLTANGSLDTSFTSMLNAQSPNMYIDDIALQPDGKILVGGSNNPDNAGHRTFVARLNPDGSLDSTFPYSEEPGRLKPTLFLLPNGKILVGKNSNGILPGRVERLNADGSPDNTFHSLAINGGIINKLLSLPNGKIFVGGKFTISVNGMPGKNLLQLSENGDLEPTVYTLNEEVLTLTVDGEGRILVGGVFTVIGANGGEGESRSYIARLTDSRTRFDFDGDGRSDLGVFSNSDGVWKILLSQTNQTIFPSFGLSSDKTAAADYDGDGKTDLAVYRPSEGNWYLWRSHDGLSIVHWGMAGDKPVAGDFDGDGKADLAVWRPSSGVWYILKSSNSPSDIRQFGLAGDMPLPYADFDGDGQTDIAVWRPSDGNFYWLESGSGNQFKVIHFGTNGDIPAAADYNGDGKTDLVVFRPSDGNWYQYLSAPNGLYTYSVVHFGLSGDEPIAADYDGDGRTDIAVRRQNIWYILRSSQGYVSAAFANADDWAIAALAGQ